jgi:phosphatidylserine decarboxylase
MLVSLWNAYSFATFPKKRRHHFIDTFIIYNEISMEILKIMYMHVYLDLGDFGCFECYALSSTIDAT